MGCLIQTASKQEGILSHSGDIENIQHYQLLTGHDAVTLSKESRHLVCFV